MSRLSVLPCTDHREPFCEHNIIYITCKWSRTLGTRSHRDHEIHHMCCNYTAEFLSYIKTTDAGVRGKTHGPNFTVGLRVHTFVIEMKWKNEKEKEITERWAREETVAWFSLVALFLNVKWHFRKERRKARWKLVAVALVTGWQRCQGKWCQHTASNLKCLNAHINTQNPS